MGLLFLAPLGIENLFSFSSQRDQRRHFALALVDFFFQDFGAAGGSSLECCNACISFPPRTPSLFWRGWFSTPLFALLVGFYLVIVWRGWPFSLGNNWGQNSFLCNPVHHYRFCIPFYDCMIISDHLTCTPLVGGWSVIPHQVICF